MRCHSLKSFVGIERANYFSMRHVHWCWCDLPRALNQCSSLVYSFLFLQLTRVVASCFTLCCYVLLPKGLAFICPLCNCRLLKFIKLINDHHSSNDNKFSHSAEPGWHPEARTQARTGAFPAPAAEGAALPGHPPPHATPHHISSVSTRTTYWFWIFLNGENLR